MNLDPPIGLGVNKVALNLIFLTFAVSATWKIINAFSYGILSFIIETRLNILPIGSTYIILLSAPVIICIASVTTKSTLTIAYLCLVCIILNLITGFRLILIWTCIVIFFFHYSFIIRIPKKKIIISIILILSCYFSYEIYRTYIEAGFLVNDSFEDSFIYSTFLGISRSAPLTYISFIDYYQVKPYESEIIFMLFRPFRQIMEFIGILEKMSYGYEVAVISETLFRDYLIWRNTPNYEATGFSMHIVPFLYAHSNRFLTVIVGANLLGYLCSVGIAYLRSSSWHKRLNGALICSFIVALSEAPNTLGMFIFGLLTVIALRFLLLIKTLPSSFGNPPGG